MKFKHPIYSLNKKVNNWSNKIDTIIDNTDIDDYSEAIKLSKKLKDKLGEYRSLGLKNKGEFSYENLVYKYLRRSGHLDKLRNFENELLDKQLSLVEQMLFFIKK